MTQFGGSLRFVQLQAIVQLLSELGSTGRLCVTYAGWTGDIIVREGQIVAARLGDERGRAALESIAVALPDGDFSFIDEPVTDTGVALVGADERIAYLDGLAAEHQRLGKLITSLELVPRLVDAPDTQITIGVAALQLIPMLVQGSTLGQLARQRGLARTVREVAVLMQGGVLELAPAATPAQVADKPAPAPVPPFAARLTARRIAAAPRQRPDASVATSAATVPNLTPRPSSIAAPRPLNTPSQPVGAQATPVGARPWPLSALPRRVSSAAEEVNTASPPIHIAPQEIGVAAQQDTTLPRPIDIAARESPAPVREVSATPRPIGNEVSTIPRIPPAVAARLADARHLAFQSASTAHSAQSAPPRPVRMALPSRSPRFAAMRSAIVRFFVRGEESPAAGG